MVLSIIKPKKYSMVGIDIGSYAIKLLEIARIGEEYQIQGYGYYPVLSPILDGNAIIDILSLAASIKQVLSSSNIKGKHVALAISDSMAISKYLQVPETLSLSEIEAFVYLEADKYIPHAINDILIDFEVLGSTPHQNGMKEVLMIASKSEHVNRMVEAVTLAGLEPLIVDVESYALERASQEIAKQHPFLAMAYFGDFMMYCFIWQDGQLIFKREDIFGKRQLIELIARQYNTSLTEALAIHRQDAKPVNYETAVIIPYIEMMSLQINRNLQFFLSASEQGLPEKIMLAGAIDWIPCLASRVKERIGLDTVIANPFKQLTFSSHLNQEISSAWMLAYGLALRTPR